jgi:hypothetical protein
MEKLRTSRPSPAIALAVLAIVAALAGTAIAGPDGSTSALTKSKVKKIATKQVNRLAPGLSVAHATSADTATNATTADSAAQAETADNATKALNADELDDLNSTEFQRSGASGSDTADAGTVPIDSNTPFPLAEGTGAYVCNPTEAGFTWVGPGAEIWLDTGDANPQHLSTTGIGSALNNGGDRFSYVFSTANRVAFLDLYSHFTGSNCHFAYQLSEYER